MKAVNQWWIVDPRIRRAKFEDSIPTSAFLF